MRYPFFYSMAKKRANKKLVLAKKIGSMINFIGLFSSKSAAIVASYLFTHPKKVPLKKWMKDFLETSDAKTISNDQFSFQSYSWGAEHRPILFLHGWESNAARWKYLIDILQHKKISCVAIDAPGHGSTALRTFTPFHYAEAIHSAVKAFNPSIIVAHSVGAYSAIIYHQKYLPKKVKYVLMAPTYSMRLPINAMFDILGLSTKVQSAFIDLVENKMNKTIDEMQSDKLVSLSQPEGLLIHDTEDTTLPYQGSVDIFNASKNLKFVTTTGHGHRLQKNEIFNLIEKFVHENMVVNPTN